MIFQYEMINCSNNKRHALIWDIMDVTQIINLELHNSKRAESRMILERVLTP